MISRSAKVALRVTAIALAAGVLVAGIFVWRAMNGPVSLGGILTARLEAMINADLSGVQVRFGDSVIEWAEGKKLAHLEFINIEALDATGSVIARIPSAKLSMSGPALLNGEVAPTRVELAGVDATLVRRADGGVQLGFQMAGEKRGQDTQSFDGGAKAVLEAMLAPKPKDTFTRFLKRFAISNAKLTIFDEGTRSSWTAEKASLTFERKPDGVVATVEAPLRLADKSSWMFSASARYVNGAEDIALEAAFKPVRLSLLASSGVGLKALKGLDIPVQGNAACNMTMAARLGRCKLWLNAGDGHLQLPALKKDPIHLKAAALTIELDGATKRYSIEEATWKGETIRGRITGDGAFAFAADGALAMLSADWTAENVTIDAPNMFEGGLALETAKFRGTFDAATERLTIDEILARRGTFELTLAGALQDHPVSIGVFLNGRFKDSAVPNLKRLWPAGAAPGAREWIVANVHEGVLREAEIAVNIAPGAIGEDGRIPDEMMRIALAMDNMRVTYLDGLPDMTNVKGTAVVTGDTFTAEMTGGNVGTVVLGQGSVVIPELHKRGTTGLIKGKLSGPTREILSILDRPRLGYPKRFGIKTNESGGKTDATFSFAIPMLRDLKAEQIGLDVAAELKDVRMRINEQLKMTGGTFALKLDMKGLKAHGAVQVNTAPTGFTWTEDFTGSTKASTRLDVTATLNEEQRARLGLDLRPYVEGRTMVVANFLGNGGKLETGRFDANLTNARLVARQLNWAKPEDAKASMKADLVFRPDGSIELSNIDAVGQGMKAQGRLVVRGGRIREADFKRLQLGERNDFTIRFKTATDGAETIDVKGRVIDAGGFLDDDESGAVDEHRPLAINADLDLAYLKGDVWFTGAKYIYADDGHRLTAFKVDASADAANLRGELIQAPDSSRKLRLQTADAGRLLRALTGFRSLIGGQLALAVEMSPLSPAQAKAESAFDGTLKIENFKLVDQPFFARLFSAGSFTGLDDLMRGEGITFTKLEQVFHGRGDMITLTNGRAAGPAIGLTTQGLVNRKTDRIDLNGTIVPLYGLNSMFEDIPLLGDILTSREGEGVFGVTYGVSGDVADLKVAVNPVSMLAPGFLRKIFQMGPTPQAAVPMPAAQPQPKSEGPSAAAPALKTN